MFKGLTWGSVAGLSVGLNAVVGVGAGAGAGLILGREDSCFGRGKCRGYIRLLITARGNGPHGEL